MDEEPASPPLPAPLPAPGSPRVFTRRRFLGGAAVVAGAAALGGAALSGAFDRGGGLPHNLQKVLANPPKAPKVFDVSRVKHVVVLMQENRSFDHYFGTLPGVRGFSDPDAMTLTTGKPVFYQPDPTRPAGYLLPFHLDSATTAAQAIPSTSHAWAVQHDCWNNGRMDRWLPAHVAADGAGIGPYTMGYYTSADLPFQWALANSFTICDNYFCSVLGPTLPNRFMLMTATIDPTGAGGGPALDDDGPGANAYSWQTYPEALQAAGVSWKVYQQFDNFGCNVLQYFRQYLAAPPSSPLGRYGLGFSTLYDGTPARDPTMAFEEDAAAGNLPTVSWIIPTTAQCEHPHYLPAAGADFVASKLNAIAGNPELWASTVFILNYDENDGLFDHVPPIVAPPGTPGEYVNGNSASTRGGGLPVGAGFRVPCIVVSPWTAGGYVCSEAFDHTSTLRFLEAVTGVPVPNLSPWRAATFGNMLSLFQPSAATGAPTLPSSASTAQELQAQQAITSSKSLPSFPAAGQTAPAQPAGTRRRIG